MPITKSNYNLPKRKEAELSKEMKEKLKRKEYEEKNIAVKGAKGSFVVFREKGLEDVFVVDEL
jgi:hypothetical protein